MNSPSCIISRVSRMSVVPNIICDCLLFLDCFTASMYLHNNNFGNSIPTQLGQLTAIKVLDLSKNHLTGQIPTQLGLLNNLSESVTRLAANATGLATTIGIFSFAVSNKFLPTFYSQMGYRCLTTCSRDRFQQNSPIYSS
jgi:hypothetical protein